jgi:hypothetical protein
MQADAILLIKDDLILLASIIPQKPGLSVAIVELIIATFEGIILTFLTEVNIDKKLMWEQLKELFRTRTMPFVFSFIGVVVIMNIVESKK